MRAVVNTAEMPRVTQTVSSNRVTALSNTHVAAIAQAKAHRVEALYAAHGLTVPVDERTLTSILGDNGGSVCASPTSALTKSMQDLSLANGGATVGIRPIRESRRVVEVEQIILQVYCPKQLPAFNKYVNAKRYDAVPRK